MGILVVAAAVIVLALAGVLIVLFGADSRDGNDWIDHRTY